MAGCALYFAGVLWLTLKIKWFWQHPLFFFLLCFICRTFGVGVKTDTGSVMRQLLGELLVQTTTFLFLPAIICFCFAKFGIWEWIKKDYIDPLNAVKERYWKQTENQQQNNSGTTADPALNGHRLHLEPRRNLPYICTFIPVVPVAVFWSTAMGKAVDTAVADSQSVTQAVNGLLQKDFGQALTGGFGMLLLLIKGVVYPLIMLIFAFVSILLIICIPIHVFSRLGRYRVEKERGTYEVR